MRLGSVDHRIEQQQRRIYERRGVVVSRTGLSLGYVPDLLSVRAIWRRQGRKLVIRATCVGGKLERFLAP